MLKFLFKKLPLLLCIIYLNSGAQNLNYLPTGIGGGGAFFCPSINPINSNEIWVASDMSGVYKSSSFGNDWSLLNALQLQGNRNTCIQFTSNPLVCYTLDHTPNGGIDICRPLKSYDGGASWNELTNDPTNGDAYTLIADPHSTDRILLSSYTELYYSANGGQSFQQIYTFNNNGNGIHIAGAYFDGNTICIGTSAGLIVSNNNGNTFYLLNLPGWPSGMGMSSFCAAKQGGITRLFAVTMSQSDLFAGITGAEFTASTGVYSCDGISSTWTLISNGIPTNQKPFFIACSMYDINKVYIGGGDTQLGIPSIYKSINGGQNWVTSFSTLNNLNVITGWCGDGGDRGWGYAEYLLGLAVAPADPEKVIFTDLGFVHVSKNGGTNWEQAYIKKSDENVATANTPVNKAYHSIGLENTSCWHLGWSDANHLFAAYSDINGIKSANAGQTWSMAGATTLNSTYFFLKHPQSNIVYASTSSIHDIYQTTRLTDGLLDPGLGGIKFTTNNGSTWQTLHDFNHSVVWMSIDPANVNRMYASVIHYANGFGEGGIWKSDNIQAGSSSVWTKLNSPPRTEGHPLTIRVLNDGSLLASFCGRRDNSGIFTASSGVFLLPAGSATWIDRSDAGMYYYTKDVVVDPADPLQNTWYAGVWSGWGGPSNGLGGLYKTINRGISWTRIFNVADRVSSITINLNNFGEGWISTETDGLWYSANLNSATPIFTREITFPFRQPERIFFNPYNANEIWVSSFGGGLYHADLNTTGIEEQFTKQPKIFPNPSNGTVHITYEKPILGYSITDLCGKIIEEKINSNCDKIQIQLHQPGIYLLKIILENDKVFTGKMIIIGK